MRNGLRHLIFVLVPVVAAFAVLPWVYSNHLLLFNFVVFLVLAQGINVIYGFTGYLPFGYVGFFGAGAYGFSLLVLHIDRKSTRLNSSHLVLSYAVFCF